VLLHRKARAGSDARVAVERRGDSEVCLDYGLAVSRDYHLHGTGEVEAGGALGAAHRQHRRLAEPLHQEFGVGRRRALRAAGAVRVCRGGQGLRRGHGFGGLGGDVDGHIRGHAGAPEAARPARRVRKILHLLHARHVDLLQNELRHAVPRRHREVLVAKVEENNAHVAAVVSVHNASAHVDVLLHRKARAGSDARVAVERRGDGEVCLDDGLAPGGNSYFLCARKVEAGS